MTAPQQQARHGHEEGHEHHGGLGVYLAVFGGLCVLTLISFAVANSPIMNTPQIGWAMMMAVSCAKALLVISFFMHLLWEANWKYVLTIPATIMSIFLVLMLVPDIGMRTEKYSEERWLHSSEVSADESAADSGEHADDTTGHSGEASH